MEKKKKLRHNEYYCMQDHFDMLYARSRNGQNFRSLIELMSESENIRLAFRNIKKNTGSNTAGVDGLTIKDIKSLSIDEVISKVQAMFNEYSPAPVRRVFIPKPNGDKRPLGIPTIWDRIFQQCILQVLEPICEAKFHKHSYGFRPNRNQRHALSRFSSLVNLGGFSQVIDIDIKGFFDNVSHGKLLKQIWALGIRDKSLLAIISKLLKAEIHGEGTPSKGTPQGGILSPLLSNIVLNELDWWLSDQWETFRTRRKYSTLKHLRALQNGSNLKEFFFVRYADDFKILCRTRSHANKLFFAVQDFLKSRLQLEISPEKSKIINLNRHDSDFLGISHRAVKRGKSKKGIVVVSRMTHKAIKKASENISAVVRKVQANPNAQTVWNYNTVVMGIQNYYSSATKVTDSLREINFRIHQVLYNRLKKYRTVAKLEDITPTLRSRYKGYNPTWFSIQGMAMVPIYAQKYKKLLNFSPDICNYTVEGRAKIHSNLRLISPLVLRSVMRTFIACRSIEYNDNRISKFVAQRGRCAVTGIELTGDEIHCHHIQPISKGGSDSYDNLLIVHSEIHKAIHMTNNDKIRRILETFNVEGKNLHRFLDLRAKAHRYDVA